MGAGDREITCQLLGSTNKAEVLENEEFFGLAWEYQYDGAEMPHSNAVMYSSDVPHARVNSSMNIKENHTAYLARRRQKTAKKQGLSLVPAGIAIALYFDTLPDMEPTVRVNQIAKKTIYCKPTFFLI